MVSFGGASIQFGLVPGFQPFGILGQLPFRLFNAVVGLPYGLRCLVNGFLRIFDRNLRLVRREAGSESLEHRSLVGGNLCLFREYVNVRGSARTYQVLIGPDLERMRVNRAR